MNKRVLFLLLLISLTFSESITSATQQEAEFNDFEIFNSWRLLIVLILLLTVVLIAIARAVGEGFNFPDLKAWANVELTQAVGTVLIIIILISTLTLIDGLLVNIVNSSGAPVTCSSTDSIGCAYDIATEYNDELIELAEQDVREILGKSYDEGLWSSFRFGVSAHPIWLGQLSVSSVKQAQKVLHVERFSILIDEYNGVLSSLYAQKFFLQEISFKVGPLLLLAGLVTRSFFATRKLGGLLLAISIGIMVVFPLMYVFDWMTLTVTLYGDAQFSSPLGITCPAACQQDLPVAFLQEDQDEVFSVSQMRDIFENDEYILSSSSASTFSQFMNLLSAHVIDDLEGNSFRLCNVSISGPSYTCPDACRFNPYPFEKEECQDDITKIACAELNPSCKNSLIIQPDEIPEQIQEQLHLCPNECRTVPALSPVCKSIKHEIVHHDKNNGLGGYCTTAWTIEQCEEALSTINIYDEDDEIIHFEEVISVLTYNDDKNNDIYKDDRCIYYKASDGSIYKHGECGNDDVCINGDDSTVTVTCTYIDASTDGKHDCVTADPECRIAKYEVSEVNGQKNIVYNTIGGSCFGEELEKAQSCAVSINPEESCMYVVPQDTDACTGCLFVDNGFTFDPPVALNCNAMCGASTTTLNTVSTGEFASAAAKGLYGTNHTRNVASFFVPAYILPLLNILVTLMFIRTFSPMLGGDVEIPGLAKIL